MFCVQASSLVSNEEEAKAALQISNKLAEALLKYHRQKEPQRQQVGADSHVNFKFSVTYSENIHPSSSASHFPYLYHKRIPPGFLYTSPSLS